MDFLIIMDMFIDIVFDILALAGLVIFAMHLMKPMTAKSFKKKELLKDSQKIRDKDDVLKSKNYIMYKVSNSTVPKIRKEKIEHMFYNSEENKLYIVEKKS